MVKKITDEEIIFLRKLGFSSLEIAELRQMSSIAIRYRNLIREGYIERIYPRSLANARLRCQRLHIESMLRFIDILKVIHLCLRHGAGGYKRKIQHEIFKDDYLGKFYYYINRTALVRLLCKALHKPVTKTHQKILTHWLKKHLTEAERIAVLWNLGVRSWKKDDVKTSIQIDGIVKPSKRYFQKRKK